MEVAGKFASGAGNTDEITVKLAWSRSDVDEGAWRPYVSRHFRISPVSSMARSRSGSIPGSRVMATAPLVASDGGTPGATPSVDIGSGVGECGGWWLVGLFVSRFLRFS
jgi:hypothetical protein